MKMLILCISLLTAANLNASNIATGNLLPVLKSTVDGINIVSIQLAQLLSLSPKKTILSRKPVAKRPVIQARLPVQSPIWFHAKVTINSGIDTGWPNKKILGNNVVGYRLNPGYTSQFFNTTGGGILDPGTLQFNPEYINLTRQTGAGSIVMRWPGGITARTLDWKKLIGPKSGRPKHTFGLNEYLEFCKRVGARPVITVPVDPARAQDILDLVEYLNAPNDGSNKLGGTDWAARRAADGYQNPWGVIWFEYGNETYNTRTISAQQYIRGYNAAYDKMKLIDPNMKLGAVLEDSDNFDDGWTVDILTALKNKIDFAIIHPYLPNVDSLAASTYTKRSIALAALSTDADLHYRLQQYKSVIRKITGRTIRVAVTEHNGHFKQEKPIPYRHTMFNALHNADYLRIMLQPTSNVEFANFWLLNGTFWGMIQGGVNSRDTLTINPTFYVYTLFNKYLGARFIKSSSSSRFFDYAGGLGVSARKGERMDGKFVFDRDITADKWFGRSFAGGTIRHDATQNVKLIKFNGTKDMNFYQLSYAMDAQPDSIYKVRVRLQTRQIRNGKIGIAVEDARGYDLTSYQPANIQLTGTNAWTYVHVNIRTFKTTKRIRVMVRRLPGGGKFSGEVDVGDIQVSKSTSNYGSVPLVSQIATINKAKNEAYIILLNKSLSRTANAAVKLQRNFQVLEVETLSGPTPYSINGKIDRPVRIRNGECPKNATDVTICNVLLPPVSVTGVRVKLL